MQRAKPPPIATLRELQPRGWLWLYCNGCRRREPTAIAPWIIRWGPQASSDKLRRSARCAECGHKGATLILPSWGDLQTGFAPFPLEPRA